MPRTMRTRASRAGVTEGDATPAAGAPVRGRGRARGGVRGRGRPRGAAPARGRAREPSLEPAQEFVDDVEQ